MFGTSPIADWSRAWAPRAPLRVSEWAEAYRLLPETSAARGAKWQNSTAPHLVSIMDAIHEPGARKVAVMACAQSGKTEASLNVLGYLMTHAPSPLLFVAATFADAERISKGRLAGMIRGTPALAAAVHDRRMPTKGGRSESTVLLKQFDGGFLALGGSNSPNTFAGLAVRIAIGDEVDRWPTLADEGDPADLLANRTRTFHDGKVIYLSTPTLKGGRIDTLYSRSDQRRYFVTCPRCAREDWISWSEPSHMRVVFDAQDATSARLECAGCGAGLGEPERGAMIAGGSWRPTVEAQEPGLVGFHAPGMLSPWISLQDLVAEFLAARSKGPEGYRVFINTSLAEGWEDRGVRTEPHALASRLEDYGAAVDAPPGVVCLTAGIDVQIDRFEVVVIGWGRGGESWVIDSHVVPGDPTSPEVQSALLATLDEPYRHADGRSLSILATCVDSGYLPEKVGYAVAARRPRRVFAIKGIGGKFGEPSILGKFDPSKPPALLNVDGLKLEVALGLEMAAPGPGYMHLSRRVCDEEFLAQLCAEHRETKRRGGVASMVWVEDRARNEALDGCVYARAALKLLTRISGARTEDSLLQRLKGTTTT